MGWAESLIRLQNVFGLKQYCLPFISYTENGLGIAACLLSCKLELKISGFLAAAVLWSFQQLL